MSFIAVAVGGGALLGLGGALISSNGAQNAAQTQASAAQSASQLQYQEFQQQQQNQQPWLAAGSNALSQMQNPSFQQSFNMSDFQQDPGYQFDLQQGQQAIDRSAAASGGLQSGGTLKAAAQYSQGMASNEYQNAYNRFNNNQTQQFNRLASLAGLGQTANGQLNQAGSAMAGQVGSNMMGAANAQGAATIAGANAYGGALSNLGNMGIQGATLSAYANPNMGGYFSGSYPGMGGGGGSLSSLGYNSGSSAPTLAAPSSGGSYFGGANPYSDTASF